ncbi:uncharacterized protein PAN0_003d1645 [Moesziomyces antarcticus]|uniref:Uncharacterized protein n=1 Tax=Pseudozyma antarctica TaxID=84753 RepID=A0A5C3FK66_PSEA2|nr:uncharacterized protein PAN0_003d1645 [Moesziomyces antarcticus]GAK63441.1 hypothetical protein PAN0_003d1645 [Moesziomyces antarcticus]SPO44027.1 uncharacterized protein PSANT_01712 [Moesziomyces antarcticus]
MWSWQSQPARRLTGLLAETLRRWASARADAAASFAALPFVSSLAAACPRNVGSSDPRRLHAWTLGAAALAHAFGQFADLPICSIGNRLWQQNTQAELGRTSTLVACSIPKPSTQRVDADTRTRL